MEGGIRDGGLAWDGGPRAVGVQDRGRRMGCRAGVGSELVHEGWNYRAFCDAMDDGRD